MLVKMRLIIIVCHAVLVLRTHAQIPDACETSNTNRAPENSDMTVKCGTTHMEVSIFICPVYNALYNESLMVLNNQYNNPACFGTPDWTVTPPILKFRFPINATGSSDCNNNFKVLNLPGTGIYADYSFIPFVNISGTINSMDLTASQITYREPVMYKYSCNYPMQYLLNNTELAVSGVNLAIKDNNGSFITTLSINLYSGSDYLEPLLIPANGLDLKTKIYVEVKATNLTERFHVLLDRCFTTTSPYPTQSTYYDLFVGCPSDKQTKIDRNGEAQVAQFSFEAFRFVEHKNLTVSTFYLHCTTRLCEVSKCASLKPDCSSQVQSRSKSLDSEESDSTPSTTVSSTPISVGQRSIGEAQVFSADNHAASQATNYSGPLVAVIICLAVIAIFITGLTIYLVVFMRKLKPAIS